jgi:superfamily I DNA/RNA helicase
MVDEAQDLSPVNHAMLDKLVKGRLISVGDPWQSIYGFRGAEQGGMDRLKQRFDMGMSDLSISFRCPEAVVRSVHWRVPHFKWSKPGGFVGELKNPTLEGILDNSAIICRNNAPLFRLAIRLLGAGRSVRVHGSDMGPKVAGIMRKLGPEDMSQDSTLSAIEDWEGERLEAGSKTSKDIADCMRVFAHYGPTLKHALAYIEHLFEQKGTIDLLTGHKAKGLEWDRVYFLDEWMIGPEEQEMNLRYVIMTRAKNELFLINSRDIR